MSSTLKAAQRRRTCLLASSFLVPVLSLGISAAKAQQISSDQLPPIEVSPPGDENRTRARPINDEGSGSRRVAPNVSQTNGPGGAPANSPNVLSPGNATPIRQFAGIVGASTSVITAEDIAHFEVGGELAVPLVVHAHVDEFTRGLVLELIVILLVRDGDVGELDRLLREGLQDVAGVVGRDGEAEVADAVVERDVDGLFHGGVTAFLVDNATTIAAAASRGQPALTAEYKLNLLSPAVGDRLICRARVIKPGRQVAVVAADVFCVTDGVEKHTATALASIAMLDEKAAARIPSPA